MDVNASGVIALRLCAIDDFLINELSFPYVNNGNAVLGREGDSGGRITSFGSSVSGTDVMNNPTSSTAAAEEEAAGWLAVL
jgi:hypothetical protein